MIRVRKVSGKTHTQQQLNDYANQNNPNNLAFQARKANKKAKKKKNNRYDYCVDSLEWFCYGNPYDYE